MQFNKYTYIQTARVLAQMNARPSCIHKAYIERAMWTVRSRYSKNQPIYTQTLDFAYFMSGKNSHPSFTRWGAPIYSTWVILSNHHPSQTARHSFSVFFFNSGWPTTNSVWPNLPISLTLTQTPLPQLTAWSQFMAGEPKRAKKGTKGEGRWVVVSLGFHRVRCLGGGSTKYPMCNRSGWGFVNAKVAPYSTIQLKPDFKLYRKTISYGTGISKFLKTEIGWISDFGRTSASQQKIILWDSGN